MSKKQKFAVKAFLNDGEHITAEINTLLECFRYAGLIKVNYRRIGDTFSDGDYIIMNPPEGLSSTKSWAEQNAQRMKTFGFATEVITLV